MKDPEGLGDQELLASLLGLAVRCPYGKPVADCPFIRYQDQPLKSAYVSLSTIPRAEREALFRFHQLCLQALERR